MSNSPNNAEHFDEVDAVRRFPSEASWLDLPAPDLGAPDSSGSDSLGPDSSKPARNSSDPESSSPKPTTESTSFVDRVMLARQEDQLLDTQLAELEQALPNELLDTLHPPIPSSTFVDKTVALVMSDRRQRWQEMLARYVSPKPSVTFVSRTLTALGKSRNATDGNHPNGRPRNQLGLPAPQNPRQSNWQVFALLAAAGIAMLWLTFTDSGREPLEARLAKQASPAFAYANSTSPMPAILMRVAHDEEPFSLFDEPADGLWLNASNGEMR